MLKNKKTFIFIVLVFALTSVLVFVFLKRMTTPRYQYAYIDVQQLAQAYNQTEEFQELYQKINEEFNSFNHALQEEADRQVETIKKEKENRKKGKNASEQRKIEEEYGEKLRKLYQERQAETEKKQNEFYAQLDQAIFSKINEVTTKVAEQEGRPLVVVKKAVYYGGKDLTPQVLAMLKNSGEQGNE